VTLERRIEEVKDAVGVSDDLARALLLKNSWNADLAMKSFAEDYNYIKRTFNFEIGSGRLPK